MLISSCEWCSAWKRQNASMRWLYKCDVQLARSMSTSTTATSAQRGRPANTCNVKPPSNRCNTVAAPDPISVTAGTATAT